MYILTRAQRGPAKELVFSDSEGEGDDVDDDEMPPTLHNFDLDAAPSDGDSEGMDDEFDLNDEEMEDDEFSVDDDEVDSAFASSNEDEDGDAEMASDDDLPPPHLRPNPAPGSDADEEDGPITTNIEDDLDNDGYTLPAVDNGGEEEEFEHGTSLRHFEQRMRWLVGVCSSKDEKTSLGIPWK